MSTTNAFASFILKSQHHIPFRATDMTESQITVIPEDARVNFSPTYITKNMHQKLITTTSKGRGINRFLFSPSPVPRAPHVRR